jgi:hypothetical protein
VPDIVATDGVVLFHIPPGMASLSVVVDPIHTCNAPVMAVGAAFTVTLAVAVQPAPSE